MSLLKKFKQYNNRHQLIQVGDKLVMGVSGGPDSVALLTMLSRMQKKESLELIVAHVNYGLRGRDSEQDEQLTRKLAKKLNLDILVKRYQAKERKGNPEELMRDFRYLFFEEIRAKYKFNKIVVAHTLDDRVETFLMNLIRGTGIRGLVSLKERRGNIIRPLLEVKKEEIVTWLKKEKVDFRIDSSNQDNYFYRNSIRNELIPFMEKKYNPVVKRKIFNLVAQLEEVSDLVENKLKKIYNDSIIKRKRNELILDQDKLSKLSIFWQGECFRQALGELKGDLNNITQTNVNEFYKIVKSTKGKRQKMRLGTIDLERVGTQLIFKIEAKKSVKQVK